MKFVLSLMILNTFPILSMNKSAINIEEFLHKQETKLFIQGYQKIWKEAKDRVYNDNKHLDNTAGIAQLIEHTAQLKPQEILTDQEVIQLVHQLVQESDYQTQLAKALASTEENNENAAQEWGWAQFVLMKAVQKQLKEKFDINFDIREQDEPPYFNPNFDTSKIDEINQNFIKRNLDLDPEITAPYFKAGFIIQAIHHQCGKKVLFNQLERLQIYLGTKLYTDN